MNRREFLHRSSLIAVAGLAGCLGGASGGALSTTDRAQTTTDRTATDRTTSEESANRFSGVRSDHAEPFRTISLGSREGVPFPENDLPRRIRVWNAADSAREISLRVFRDGATLLDRTLEFGPDAYLTLVLNEPADYRIAVGLSGAQATTFEITRGSFDCNTTTTDAGAFAGGRVETVTMSTAVGCPGPTVADTDFSVGQGECGTDHHARVSFEGGSVSVSGAVRTSTPRANLELAEATYDRQADALTVRVRSTDSEESGVGTQCVGEVPYEATVGFEHALPGAAVVVHESMGKTVDVARATRPK